MGSDFFNTSLNSFSENKKHGKNIMVNIWQDITIAGEREQLMLNEEKHTENYHTFNKKITL